MLVPVKFLSLDDTHGEEGRVRNGLKALRMESYPFYSYGEIFKLTGEFLKYLDEFYIREINAGQPKDQFTQSQWFADRLSALLPEKELFGSEVKRKDLHKLKKDVLKRLIVSQRPASVKEGLQLAQAAISPLQRLSRKVVLQLVDAERLFYVAKNFAKSPEHLDGQRRFLTAGGILDLCELVHLTAIESVFETGARQRAVLSKCFKFTSDGFVKVPSDRALSNASPADLGRFDAALAELEYERAVPGEADFSKAYLQLLKKMIGVDLPMLDHLRPRFYRMDQADREFLPSSGFHNIAVAGKIFHLSHKEAAIVRVLAEGRKNTRHGWMKESEVFERFKALTKTVLADFRIRDSFRNHLDVYGALVEVKIGHGSAKKGQVFRLRFVPKN